MYGRAEFAESRRAFHEALLQSCLTIDSQGRPSNSDSSNQTSIRLAKGIAPTPSRLASIALGTGDIDCVYHFALYELQETARALGMGDAADTLDVMVNGDRLKDISDLPLDLAV